MPRQTRVALPLMMVALVLWPRGSAAQQGHPLDEIVDCSACPTMVVIPAGEFTMGFPDDSAYPADERPQLQVRLDRPFAISRFEITRDQFQVFVEDSYWGRREDKPCRTYSQPGEWRDASPEIDWMSPGFQQTGNHPVVCVSWNDAVAYAAWLSNVTGQTYRLPTAAEFEYAHRAGATADLYWGEESQVCEYANTADQSLIRVRPGRGDGSDPPSCNDGYPFTSPVGSFKPNSWGVYDMAGNVNEWVQDCWKATHRGKPTDGKAYQFEGCPLRRLKSGSWWSDPSGVRIQKNFGFLPTERWAETGFRLVRELTPG